MSAVATDAEAWNAENSNGRTAANSPAGWLPNNSVAGHIGDGRHETCDGFHDRISVRAFQVLGSPAPFGRA